LQPVRETKSGRLSRNIPVQAMSTTTGGWLFLESGLEHELATTVPDSASVHRKEP